MLLLEFQSVLFQAVVSTFEDEHRVVAGELRFLQSTTSIVIHSLLLWNIRHK